MDNVGWHEIRIIQENITQLIGLIKSAAQAEDHVMEHLYIGQVHQEAVQLTRVLQQLTQEADQRVKDVLFQMEQYLTHPNGSSQEICIQIKGLLITNKWLIPFYQHYLKLRCGFSDFDFTT